jgi:large subunit ribosomal protein L32e
MEAKKRKKPYFVRKDWHRFLRMGKKRKKKRVWRDSKGRHGKVRLRVKGKMKRPTSGFGQDKRIFGLVENLIPVFVENISRLSEIKKNEGIIISGKLGKRKREEIIKKAEEKNIKILNKYKEKENESKQ